MSDTLHCKGFKADSGEPCGSLSHLVGPSGYCPAHDPGNAERMKEIATRGGHATAAKHASAGFTADELPAIITLEDAKRALDVIRVAVMTRKLTHAEGNAASKSVSEWVKAESAAVTGRIVNELQKDLDAKTEEIAALKLQLASGAGRRIRAVS